MRSGPKAVTLKAARADDSTPARSLTTASRRTPLGGIPLNSLRFAIISDTHWTTDPDMGDSRCWNQTLRSRSLAAMPALSASLLEQRPDFILHLGDMTESGSRESLKSGLSPFSSAGVPIYFVKGNHDGGEVEKMLTSPGAGGCWSSFCRGNWLFLLLDNTLRECDLDSASSDRRRRRLQPQQREWLTETLRRHPDKRAVVCSHMPLVTRSIYDVRTSPDGEPVRGMTGDAVGARIGWFGDAEETLSLLYREGRPALFLCGHWHLFDILRHRDAPYVFAPSACEYPCEYLFCKLGDSALTVTRHPSGVDPALSLMPESGNLFPAGDHGREYTVSL